jgi:1,4-alpha-glucan branching enzyme
MIIKEPQQDGQSVRVTFELPSSVWAERVNLVGDFNNWSTTEHEMRQSRATGNWSITLLLAAGRRYAFRYLVNGRDWHNDWHADEFVSNQYGSDNSVINL